MNWLEGVQGTISEVEAIDLIDSWLWEVVNKILTKTERRKINRKKRKEEKKLKGKTKRTKLPKKRDYNTEHLIPKTRWWTYHHDNLKQSRKTSHQGKHAYLWVKLPHEQLKQIMGDNFQVLHKETREMIVEEIEAILDYYIKWEELYEKKCFKNNKHPRK